MIDPAFPSFASLEDVVQDPVFPDVDIALRRGRHIDLADSEWFTFLAEAQSFLEIFYRRFGCELIRAGDSYFFLLPSGDRLGRRQLTKGEMLVGQALALLFLDPATVKAMGVVSVGQLLEVLVSQVGRDRLVGALNSRKKPPKDERVAEEMVRTEVVKAVRSLERLGFVERLADDQLRLRTPLTRFSDPVRGLADPAQALAQLIQRGHVIETGKVDDQDSVGEDEEDGK